MQLWGNDLNKYDIFLKIKISDYFFQIIAPKTVRLCGFYFQNLSDLASLINALGSQLLPLHHVQSQSDDLLALRA